MPKVKVFHFNNGSGGGVLSVIKNLMTYSQSDHIENHVIYTIEESREKNATIIDFPEARSVHIFRYSRNWNFYHTCKELAKLLPDEDAVIVAHDWLELGMASQLGLQNPVVQFLHGDFEYYYGLGEKHNGVIDAHVAVSPIIKEKLKSRKIEQGRVIYCRFPVPDVDKKIRSDEGLLKAIYCVRDLREERKQFKLLPLINQLLIRDSIMVQWTIIGRGKSEAEMKISLGDDVKYFPMLPNTQVFEKMLENDFYVLPSTVEGFPVAVVEAMKCGLIPLISDWNGATDELVIEGETGYYFAVGDAGGYASRIAMLNNDRKLLKQLSERAVEQANFLFDPFENTKAIENIIDSVSHRERRLKRSEKVYGSRLDKRCMPNSITTFLRGLRPSRFS